VSAHATSPAVFLDRDGTLIREIDYLSDPRGVELLDGAAAAICELNTAGLPVVLITNQSGVARGLLDEPTLDRIHARVRELLAEGGAHLDLILHCPHHPEHGLPPLRCDCECRKPRPGLLHTAAARLGLNLQSSWMIGDACRDLEAGWRVGARGLLVSTGKGSHEAPGARAASPGDGYLREVKGLAGAVKCILADRLVGPA